MAIDVKLFHRTSYRYDKLVTMGPQVVRLRPAPHCRSQIVSYSMQIEPEGQRVNWQQDPFSNYLARVAFPEKTDRFEVIVGREEGCGQKGHQKDFEEEVSLSKCGF